MILLESKTAPGRLATVFGIGQIGSAIVRAMVDRDWQVVRTRSFPWSDAAGHREILESHADEIGARQTSGDERLDIVWSAGRAGFDASPSRTAEELASFESVLDFADVVTASGRRVHFHLISSAGGLFEGQRFVGLDSHPRPRRPYGRLKWEQERLLASRIELRSHVYRLSSVFGTIAGGRRRGLVGTLVENSLRHRETTIVGRMSTLRDFVAADDAGRFVVDNMETDRNTTHLLASGRPTSILEIVRRVEWAVRRPVPISCVPRPTNGVDITFRRSALPAGWNPRDVRSAIPGLVNDAIRGSVRNPYQSGASS